jgi:hypothetical protein
MWAMRRIWRVVERMGGEVRRLDGYCYTIP